MDESSANAWKSAELTQTYLRGVRGAIPLAAEQIEIMLRLIDAGQLPIQRFLDLGCGSGTLSAALLAHYPASQGVLLDFSQPMLEAARSSLAAYAGRTVFLQADYGDRVWTSLLAEVAPFDAIVSGLSIHHQPDERKRELYVELLDLLRPGGFFVNIEHVASATRWLEERFEEHFIDALHDYHLRNGGEKSRQQVAHEFYHRPDKQANLLAPVEAQCQWLREIGFQDVDCYLKLFDLAVFGGRRPPAG